MIKTYKIVIQGQVQGVGFRPFVFSLATKHKLSGQVFNNEVGVVIFLNTSEKKKTDFLTELLENLPKIAVVQNHTIEAVESRKFEGFQIIASERKHQINLPLTPDFAICEDCKAEIEDPKNRRYQYVFTTCIKCGPRYSITTKFPFERANTTLAAFKMCSICEKEYKNSLNPRFHSQTNSCAECGIKMSLEDPKGNIIEDNQQEILIQAAQYIAEGKIVAIKNTNGYLLCCDANNEDAVQLLRERKKRPAKPFALLYPSLELIKRNFEISENEEMALTSAVSPIVILQVQKNPHKLAMDSIAPNLIHLGVMLPSSALLQLLMNKVRSPIVATSGNIHGSPIISESQEARKSLKNVADYFIHHNLEIQFPQDDSVVKFIGEEQIILRRSRGLAPNYIDLNKKKLGDESLLISPLIAMGAHLKSTFSFVPNSNFYVSQYFGNLDNYQVSERFKNTIRQFTDVFETTPKTILVDSHPQYQSSIIGKELADEWGAEVRGIQHHKAHFASVLAEHNLFDSKEKILGVVWDGAGWGDDNAIWGGEFFTYQNHKMERIAHFEYFDWIVADKFSKEPRLVLLSLLSEEKRESIQHKFSETEWKVYVKLLKRNAFVTSSVGRLFDAVASLLDITDYNIFEGEAAMRMETVASNYNGEYFIDFLEHENRKNLSAKKIIDNIQKSLLNNISKEQIAASFIFTLAQCIIQLALRDNIKTIACSGGVFQNSVLIRFLKSLIAKHSLLLILNRKLSCNDENISFGQLQYHLNVD